MEGIDVAKIGGVITQEVSDLWIASYQSTYTNRSRGFLFGKDIILDLLSNQEAQGLWIINGLTDQSIEKLVLYPADESGNILENVGPVDQGQLCPPNCPVSL